MGLRAKFNLAMAFVFLVGLGLTGMVAYNLTATTARQQVLGEAAIMNGQANALAQFTVSEIAPMLADQMERRFLPQSVPAWVTQTNFRVLQQKFPDYSFNVTVENPTNPASRPTDWQAEIIRSLKAQPSLTELVTERDTPSGRILSVSRPVVVTNPACLRCHSTPDAAPITLVDLYGPRNGFGWKLNEVIGAQIVSVPMSVPTAQAWRTFTQVMSALVGVFVVMMVLLNVLLQFVIIKPVRAIAAQATAVSVGNMDAPEIAVRGRDEISALAEAFNRMRRSLANAMKILGE
jgi:HAMP domain-containing protein